MNAIFTKCAGDSRYNLYKYRRIGQYREVTWIPKHWVCNIATGKSFVIKLSEGGVFIAFINVALVIVLVLRYLTSQII